MKDFKLNRFVLIGILFICIVSSLSIGVSSFSVQDLLHGEPLAQQIFWQVRVVRVLALIFAACGMVVSGLIMQQLAQNKFASPTSVATLDGAKLGVMLSLVFFPHNVYIKTFIAFVFAMAATAICVNLINKVRVKNVIFVPLFGLIFGGIINSVTTFLAYRTDQIQQLTNLEQANMTHLLKGNYEILYLVIPAVIIAYVYANQFTIAGMGRSFATNLGLNYRRITTIGLLLVAIITGAVVISVGPIPFLGLIIPNIASIYYGDKIKNSMFETSLLGCIFLFVCDIVGRLVIFPYEIPLALSVGIIGCVAFLLLIFNKKNENQKEVTSN